VGKGAGSPLLIVIAGVVAGLIVGCLLTWFPIRLLFCSLYNTPDCEEIVLIAFPFYCIITPILGGMTAYLLYRRQRGQN